MPTPEIQSYVDLHLVRVVLREQSDQQWIFLEETAPAEGNDPRGFPIVIGFNEAGEIHRLLTDQGTPRPLTHQLTADAIGALGSRVLGADIIDLRANTFYARLRLSAPDSDDPNSGDPSMHPGDAEMPEEISLDARPSDAVALALRHGAQIRVAEFLLEQVRTDSAVDALPASEEDLDFDSDGGLASGGDDADPTADPMGEPNGDPEP